MISIIGAGLAGCEAAFQYAKAGKKVRLFEMKPEKMSPAHKLPGPAELVCSNSLGSQKEGSAGALLKAEMRVIGSIILDGADKAAVPAGSALAVNREAMSHAVSEILAQFDNIEIISGEISQLPESGWIATGPLTSDSLTTAFTPLVGDRLHFFDATSPIVETSSINMKIAYAASRYGKGDPDYLNCPMDKEQYEAFYQAVLAADVVTPHDFEDSSVFEGCMPIEQLARRGPKTLSFGPLRPVGLEDPRTGRRPFAVVQLRKEDTAGSAYNLVGFQTRMTFPEQARVFRMIPGLENAEFLRFGVMHRNTYIDSPNLLTERFRLRSNPALGFLGQITGVEGYVESTAVGMLGALMDLHPQLPPPPPETIMGALHRYITAYEGKDFQPMAANFGLLPPFEGRIPKKERKLAYHRRGLDAFKNWAKDGGLID